MDRIAAMCAGLSGAYAPLDAASAPPPFPTCAILIASLIASFSWMAKMAIMLIGPAVIASATKSEASSAEETRSLLAVAYRIGCALALLVFGRLSDATGRKPIIALGLLADAAMCLALGISGGRGGVAWWACMLGGGLNGSAAALWASVRDAVPRRHQPLALSIVACMMAVATGCLPYSYGLLTPAGLDRLVYFLMSGTVPELDGEDAAKQSVPVAYVPLQRLASANPLLIPAFIAALADLLALALVPALSASASQV